MAIAVLQTLRDVDSELFKHIATVRTHQATHRPSRGLAS